MWVLLRFVLSSLVMSDDENDDDDEDDTEALMAELDQIKSGGEAQEGKLTLVCFMILLSMITI